jgi:hypothetical protein
MSKTPDFGDLRVTTNFLALWDQVRNLGVFKRINEDAPVPLPPGWRDRPRDLATVLDAQFSYFAAREGKRRWCEKTPQHVQHLAALAELFPAAKFVHVIRDGRDCAASFHRRWRRQPELTIYRWKKVVAAGHDQGQQLGAGRYLEIRYEDLTAAPDISLRRICEFLGLPFDAAVLDSARPHMQTEAAGAGRGLLKNSGKWQTYFSPAMQHRLERIAGALLARYRYPTTQPQADAEVPVWQRRYWASIEAVRQYGREIRRKLNGELERPWRVILAKPLNALRQRQHNEY